MLLCAHVSFGGSLAEETTWTKRIVEKKTPQWVGKNSVGTFFFSVFFSKSLIWCLGNFTILHIYMGVVQKSCKLWWFSG